MHVRVRLFAGLRERAGRDVVELDLPEGARVADALQRLAGVAGEVAVVMAVNREYANATTPLRADDELALIPPVSGGADMINEGATATGRLHVRITDAPLVAEPLLAYVADPRAGALVTFHGVTREVPALEYEAYAEMALCQIEAVVREAIEHHRLCAAAVEHRVGEVSLGEASVIVAASARHRGEAFAGAREMIDRVKALAPIWKREDGTWVEGSLPPEAS